MIAAAVKYRQTEKNTPPDFSTYPPTLRNSVYCQKAPKNSQLNGLVQAQDSANDPNLFFDPATRTTVTRGSQSNTLPFSTNGTRIASNISISTANFSKAPPLVNQVRLAARGMMDGTNSTSHDGNGEKVLDANNKNNGTSTNDGKGSDKKDGGNKKDGGKNGDKKNGDKKKNKDGNKKNGGKKDDGKKGGDNKNGDNKNGDSKNGNDKNGNKKSDSNLKTNASGNMGNSTLLNPMKDGNNKTADGVKSNMGSNNGTNKHNGMHNNNGTNMANGKNGTDLTNSNNGTNLTNSNNGTNLTNSNATNLTSGNNSTDVTNGNNSTNIGNFGSCSVPEIQFGAGFDGRRETAFEPVDKGNSFPFYPLEGLYADATTLIPSELQPRFGAEHRHHHPIHVRPTREHLQGRRYRQSHLCPSQDRC